MVKASNIVPLNAQPSSEIAAPQVVRLSYEENRVLWAVTSEQGMAAKTTEAQAALIGMPVTRFRSILRRPIMEERISSVAFARIAHALPAIVQASIDLASKPTAAGTAERRVIFGELGFGRRSNDTKASEFMDVFRESTARVEAAANQAEKAAKLSGRGIASMFGKQTVSEAVMIGPDGQPIEGLNPQDVVQERQKRETIDQNEPVFR